MYLHLLCLHVLQSKELWLWLPIMGKEVKTLQAQLRLANTSCIFSLRAKKAEGIIISGHLRECYCGRKSKNCRPGSLTSCLHLGLGKAIPRPPGGRGNPCLPLPFLHCKSDLSILGIKSAMFLHISIASLSPALATCDKWKLKSVAGGILVCCSQDQYPSMQLKFKYSSLNRGKSVTLLHNHEQMQRKRAFQVV